MVSFDVWIIGFEPGEAPPAERLQAAFGIDLESARSLERSVPRVVKHGVSAKRAGEMRQALEAIGAVVDCRPARDAKPRVAGDAPAVFRAPDADLFPAGRISAIDPFVPSDGSVPRISIDEAPPRVPPPTTMAPAEGEPQRRITASLLATSRAQQRRKFIQQAIGTVVAGCAIVAIGWFFGNSVFRGGAGWIDVGFDGLGIYFIGVGMFDLVTTLRS
ncbi:MAG: hypothetical protein JRE81_01100 [Deltaproteobacteria bacterium]|jgi:hypothetical protein|nr:hypothetical protein [Deltaproteobacteria bacterium]